MTDYNDGKWHGWDGGKCPVHPKSRVDYVWHDPRNEAAGCDADREAIEECIPQLAWAHVVKFRVVKAYREPRECWSYGAHIHDTEAEAIEFRTQVATSNPGKGYENHPITKWREVIE